jgi:hypothetical protein
MRGSMMLELTDFSWLVISLTAFVSGFFIGDIYGSWKYSVDEEDKDE